MLFQVLSSSRLGLNKSQGLKYQFGGKIFVAAMEGSGWRNPFSIVNFLKKLVFQCN
jgi:hypothetical protein